MDSISVSSVQARQKSRQARNGGVFKKEAKGFKMSDENSPKDSPPTPDFSSPIYSERNPAKCPACKLLKKWSTEAICKDCHLREILANGRDFYGFSPPGLSVPLTTDEDEREAYYRERHERHWREMAGALLVGGLGLACAALYSLFHHFFGY